MKKLILVLLFVFALALPAQAAIRVVVHLHSFDLVAGNLIADVEIKAINGVVQRTTLSTAAAGLVASQVLAGLKNLIISHVKNSPEFGNQTVAADEILFEGTPG